MKHLPSKTFADIYESYINGDILLVNDKIKKLNKDNRKLMYMYASGKNENVHNSITMFFLNLI